MQQADTLNRELEGQGCDKEGVLSMEVCRPLLRFIFRAPWAAGRRAGILVVQLSG